ncbi:arginine-rich splicing factor 7-like [Octopus vulgaris]|uniref:Arginine-rich splicing factor 7-like n=2 Tax=Octopus TaxID=6643 RepID=A0AA36C217_OCTVU|nr:arginine-rich splicing factor 7-like [Octopus vulgaris]
MKVSTKKGGRNRQERKQTSTMGRSRSRSQERRWYSYSYSHSRSRSRSPSEDGVRVHVADLGEDPSKRELECVFEKFGKLLEVWVAKSPPCFAFIVYKYREDADAAIKEMDGKLLSGGRIRVSLARPRTRGRRRRVFDPNLRCYQCGRKGHFFRDCDDSRRYPRRRYVSRDVVNGYGMVL